MSQITNAAYVAAGKALLSNWKPDRVMVLLQEFGMKPLTSNTITSPEVFLNELKKTAERGYALDMEENENNVICIAAPIRDCLGNNIAAVSLSGVYTTTDFAMIQDQYIPLAVETAREISACMGYADRAAGISIRGTRPLPACQ